MSKTAIFRDRLFVEHDPGFDHPESPERLIALYSTLDALAQSNLFIEPKFDEASRETLLLNHSGQYLDQVAATAGKIYSVLEQDTFASKKSYQAACLAAGALTTGIDLLWQGRIKNGFAMVRPPGHHAQRTSAMGYCIFNNVALAAHHAIARHNVERILIVDWDVHHGNGTQESFYATDRVLFISIHQSPLYPGSGGVEETGIGRGEGYTVNIPLPGGQGDREYANIFNSLVLPIAYQYRPELVLISAGFDSCLGDPVSAMRLSWQGFAYMARTLVQLAVELCQGRLLVALEGGYELEGLKEGAFAVLAELVGGPLPTPFPSHLDEEAAGPLHAERGPHPAVERVRAVAKNYWNL